MSDKTPAKKDTGRRKTVRSFVRREGRLTRGQQRALDELWPRWGLAFDRHTLNLDELFGRVAPRVLEIGFGNGDALASMAAERPDVDFLGVEVHRPGIGHLLMAIERLGLSNIRIVCHDAVEVLHQQIPAASLQRVHIFFPDPWPKKRHHKRRLVQTAFLDLLASRLLKDGSLHLATDWQAYAEDMLQILTKHPCFRNQVDGNDLDTGCVPRPAARPLTRFEQRGHRHGHSVWDLLFICNDTVRGKGILPR